MRVLIFLFVFGWLFASCKSANEPTYFDLQTSVSPDLAGTVTPNDTTFEGGTELELIATPAEGYRFVKWAGDIQDTSNPLNITMDEEKNVIAEFQLREYPLTIIVEGDGTVQEEVVSAKTKDYDHGTLVKLTAVPEDGWEFSKWTGDIQDTSNPLNITMDEEKNVIAEFQLLIEYIPLELGVEWDYELSFYPDFNYVFDTLHFYKNQHIFIVEQIDTMSYLYMQSVYLDENFDTIRIDTNLIIKEPSGRFFVPGNDVFPGNRENGGPFLGVYDKFRDSFSGLTVPLYTHYPKSLNNGLPFYNGWASSSNGNEHYFGNGGFTSYSYSSGGLEWSRVSLVEVRVPGR